MEVKCEPLFCDSQLLNFGSVPIYFSTVPIHIHVSTRFFFQITGIANPGKTVSILVRGSNKLVLEEAERSLHDALCVVRCLVKNR